MSDAPVSALTETSLVPTFGKGLIDRVRTAAKPPHFHIFKRHILAAGWAVKQQTPWQRAATIQQRPTGTPNGIRTRVASLRGWCPTYVHPNGWGPRTTREPSTR